MTYVRVIERLMSFVDFDPITHCMNWTGHKNQYGYGKFRAAQLPGQTLAHRAAYIVWNGPIQKGLEIDHRCNNRGCINPQHLWAVTHFYNVSIAPHRKGPIAGFCKRGHVLAGANIKVVGGKRYCRACKKILSDKWNAIKAQRRRDARFVRALDMEWVDEGHPCVVIIKPSVF